MTLVHERPPRAPTGDARALIEEARRRADAAGDAGWPSWWWRRSRRPARRSCSEAGAHGCRRRPGRASPGAGASPPGAPAPTRSTDPPAVPVLRAGTLGARGGWALTASALYVTEDRGRTWRAVTPPVLGDSDLVGAVQSVAAAGSDDLWVAMGNVIGLVPWSPTNRGTNRGEGIERSVDGGATWSFSTLPGCLQGCGADLSLSFVDARHGFATIGPVGPSRSRLFSTTDGGATWHAVCTLPVDRAGGAELLFTSTRDGWAQIQNPGPLRGALYRTTDGGETWHQAPGLPTGGRYEPPQFFGGEDGVVLGVGRAPVVFVTSDGGRTWSPRRGAVGRSREPIQLAAVTPRVWDMFVGTAMFATTDGGRQWARVTPQPAWPPGWVASAGFYSVTDGWAVVQATSATCPRAGCLPRLMATGDGGRHWTTLGP